MKNSFTINLNDCVNTNDNYYFPNPIILDTNKQYEAGLVYFCGWNNIHNITDENNVFSYSSDDGKSFKKIKLINGAYDISDIDKEIKRNLEINNDYDPKLKTYPINLEVFKMGSKVVLNIMNDKYYVDFVTLQNSLVNLLGFKKGYNIAENHANITHIQSIHIDCDLIESNYVFRGDKKSIKRPLLYSFPAYTVPIGARIVESPANPRMFPVHKKTIDFININIYDNNGKQINFNNEPFGLEILICETF